MLVHTQCPHRVTCSGDLPDGFILPDIPQLHLSVSRATNQFPEPTTLHMHISNPLLVLPPTSDHS